MKPSTQDNGKLSNSVYSNTCVSLSPPSSGHSFSSNSNRSESSGYCGRNPSAFGFSNYALPQPISRKTEHKKKKSKTSTANLEIEDKKLEDKIATGQQSDVGYYNALGRSSDFESLGKNSEVAHVESVEASGRGEHNGDSNSTDPEGGAGTITNPLNDITSNGNSIKDGFVVVISLHDGLVVDTTPSLKAALGYKRESWAGQPFIDFVHPKDKATFTDRLAKNINEFYGDRDLDLKGRRTSLFCNLQKYNETRSSGNGSDENNSVNAKKSLYNPFHLTMSVDFYRCKEKKIPRVMLLTITVHPVLPVYRAPEEMIISAIFSTRHDPNCILTQVHHNAVQYLGYLPQDIIGKSLFDFYHPEDLPFIKKIYETTVIMAGSPFRSNPYRFAAQNGGYVVLETEWSSFVNPWTEKIEFVIGHHRVLRGPSNPDVFQPSEVCQRSLLANISEEIFKESKIIQGEIRALLNEKIRKTQTTAYNSSSRSKDLTAFVENLLHEGKHLAPVSKDPAQADDRSISEHDSVIVGAISPHHEYCDSKSSSGTPPSYNQLNYQEKIDRFFKSEPLVHRAFGSDKDNINSSNQSNGDIGKSSSNLTGTKTTTPNDSGSGENLSNGSNNRASSDSRDARDNARSANKMMLESSQQSTLTESLLNQHNIDMEKLMVKQHKERRSEMKNNKQPKDFTVEELTEKSKEHDKERTKNRNRKRLGSRSQTGGFCKVSKLDVTEKTCTVTPVPHANTNDSVIPMSISYSSPSQTQSSRNLNICPSRPVAASQVPQFLMPKQTVPLQEAATCPLFTPIVPIYYLSAPRDREHSTHQIPNEFSRDEQVPPNTYVSYVTIPLGGMIYSPIAVSRMCTPFVAPEPVTTSETLQSNARVNQQENRKRSESQATSVKAEPGCTMTMSESSKKVLSIGEHLSSCVSIDGRCSSLVDIQTTANTKDKADTNSPFDSSLEDSSDSSFYGSFLNTTSNSSCNQDQSVARPQQAKLWKPTIPKPTENEREQFVMMRNGSQWQGDLNITSELIYQYQLTPKPLKEVLESDKKALRSLHQPEMINDQLAQLYSDMELGGYNTKLLPSEGDNSFDNKSEDSGSNTRKDTPEQILVRNDMKNSMMAMVYEEDAPMPSP